MREYSKTEINYVYLKYIYFNKGLVDPDKGSINVLGNEVRPGHSFMSVPYMLGYCHRTGCLVDDLTVQETLTLYCSVSFCIIIFI